MKTPLRHVQGAESRRGDPATSAKLAKWFRLDPEEAEAATEDLHRLHPYPGRMHPLWARRIIADLPKDVSVLDPFCGGGTVLVESRLAGVHARGNDINPIAVRLARLRCIPPPQRDLVIEEADRCYEDCTERRDTPFSELAQGEEDYPKHVLAALISLRDEISKTKDIKTRELLLFCLSPLLDKFAARAGRAAPRVPRDAVRDHFRLRVDRWIAAFDILAGQPWAEAEMADSRWLPWKPASSTALITSPPYPGVFDYVGEQHRRMQWLGASPDDARAARRKEIGKRFSAPYWTSDMRVVLWQACRTLRVGSPLYLVVGDGVMGNQVVRTDEALESLCKVLPLEFVAVASQRRPHFHRQTADLFGPRGRQEHLVMLRRVEGELAPLPRSSKETPEPPTKKPRTRPRTGQTKTHSKPKPRAKRSK